MLANDCLRVPPFRRCHIQSRLIKALAIEIEIRLKNGRYLSAGSVKIQDDIGQSRVGVHLGSLLAGLDNGPIPNHRGLEPTRPTRRGDRGGEPRQCVLKVTGVSSWEIGIQDVFRGLQAQRREGQRRVGGRAGGERAAADHKKIFVVAERWNLSTTEVLGSLPIRQVPMI